MSFNMSTDSPTSPPVYAVSQNLQERFEWITNVYITPIVAIIGITGNSVGLWVLAKNHDKRAQTIYPYLFALMASHIPSLILSLLLTLKEVLLFTDPVIGSLVNSYVLLYPSYIVYTLRCVTAAMVILMSTERLKALLQPRANGNNPKKNARWIILTVIIVSVVFMIPQYAVREVAKVTTMDNQTMYTALVKPENIDIFVIHVFIVAIALHYMAPAVVLVLGIMLLVTFSRHLKQRNALASNQRSNINQTKLTVMVVCVAGMFIGFSIPIVFLQTLVFIDRRYNFDGEYKATFFLLANMADLFARLNACIDVIVYILAANDFRSILHKIFCKCTRKTNKVTDSTVSTRLS